MSKYLLILLAVIPTLVSAENNTPRKISDAFFKSVMSNNISKAYDQLFIGSSIPSSKPQAVTMLKQQTQSGLPIYGKILGYEFIKEEKFGSTITRLMYVLKSEKSPTIWEFYYYKPKNKWFLANINFNDQYSLLR